LFDELRPHLGRNAIDTTVVVQTLCRVEETTDLLAAAAREPLIGGVVGWVDLSSPSVSDRLVELIEGKGGDRLVAIRHLVQSEPDPRWLCREDVSQGIRAVSAANLVTEVVVRPWQLSSVFETVRDLDGVSFVLDHGGKPNVAAGSLPSWREDVSRIGKLPNVAVKLSGLVTEAGHRTWTVDQLRPYCEVLLETFGTDRTMWGSDWPVCLLAASYDEVALAAEELTSHLSGTEKEAIFGATALQWYSMRTI
jgi:L-fuconolactonase